MRRRGELSMPFQLAAESSRSAGHTGILTMGLESGFNRD